MIVVKKKQGSSIKKVQRDETCIARIELLPNENCMRLHFVTMLKSAKHKTKRNETTHQRQHDKRNARSCDKF